MSHGIYALFFHSFSGFSWSTDVYRSTAYSTDYGVFQILVKRVIMIFFSPFLWKSSGSICESGLKLTWETTQKSQKQINYSTNIRKNYGQLICFKN